ncbi:MAG TPA: 50S ribosomal protein L6 [Patescibacteria group bacterium]|nr:50S ribosomal protein L6 [Patescibacteria group bacterium]
MSKFAKRPVTIPAGVQIQLDSNKIKVTGAKGNLEREIPETVQVSMKENELSFGSKEKTETKFGRSILGTTKSHVVNMIEGVTNGFNKKLELQGTGYRAEVRGNDLVLTIGFSHPVTFTAPTNVKFVVEKNVVTVEGIDLNTVTQLAANIRRAKEPDPYKGKGIRYLGEVLKLKPGKQAAKTAA